MMSGSISPESERLSDHPPSDREEDDDDDGNFSDQGAANFEQEDGKT